MVGLGINPTILALALDVCESDMLPKYQSFIKNFSYITEDLVPANGELFVGAALLKFSR